MPRPLQFLGSLVLTALAASAGATALSGEARSFVERLGRASGVPLSAPLFTGTSASQRVASTFQDRGRCVTESTLSLLQRQPTNAGVRAMLIDGMITTCSAPALVKRWIDTTNAAAGVSMLVAPLSTAS